jgi:hypothetical protein
MTDAHHIVSKEHLVVLPLLAWSRASSKSRALSTPIGMGTFFSFRSFIVV